MRRAYDEKYRFLSTPSARRATFVCRASDFDLRFLSTPSARRATVNFVQHCQDFLFLSTPSARRATYLVINTINIIKISIHALREEGDLQISICPRRHLYFYPRPPRGGRQAPKGT